MISLTSAILITVLVFCSFCSGHVSGRDCAFEFKSTYSSVFLSIGASFQKECVYQSNCLSEVNVYLANKPNVCFSDKPISSNYDSFYKTSSSYDHQNKSYKYAFSFSRFDSSYIGLYRCVINEIGNETNQMSNNLVHVITYAHEQNVEKCFLPTVKDIIVDRFIFPNGSVVVNLTWNITEKDSKSLPYCSGSRHWRVKIQHFLSVDDTPGDRDTSTSTKDADNWINVPGGRQDYLFLQLLDNVTYYQFLVSNQPKKVVEVGRYRSLGSHIYYFGRQSPPVIDQTLLNVVMDELTSETVKCTARGFPPPLVRWVKVTSNGGSVTERRENGSSTLVLNDATSGMSGEYYCLAQNMQVNPPGGKRTVDKARSIIVTVREYRSSDDLRCEFADSAIPSSFCRSYLHTQLPIYINTSSDSQEDYISLAMTNIWNNTNDQKCEDLANSLLCHTVYPYCDARQPLRPLPRPICMGACNEFIHGKCSADAESIKRGYPSVYQTIISRCQSSEGGEAPECIPLSYDASRKDQVQLVEDTGSCVRGNGIGYTGMQVRTRSNHLCQLWMLQTPHKHPMLPSVYVAELRNAGYSCRNPGGLGERPWCYTSHPSVRWEYCNIPSCLNCSELMVESNKGLSVSYSSNTYNSTAMYSCKNGYSLVGVAARTCLSSGKWSGNPPYCQIVSCSELMVESNEGLSVSYSSTTYNSTATYSCKDGYSLVGVAARTCLSNGNWSGDTPSCQIIVTSSDRLGVIMNMIPMVIVTVTVGVLAVLLVIFFTCIIKKRKRIKPVTNEATRSIAFDCENHTSNQLKEISSDYINQLSKHLISGSNLKILESVGRGEFGIVYRGLISVKNRMPQAIAAKTLKGLYSKSDIDSLLDECVIMMSFDNLNVLPLIGVCLDLGPAPYIIMPFMSRGSLLSYLKKERANLTVADTSEEDIILNVRKQLLSICLQVANGMCYLALQRFIHRDLAARNCMIDDNGIIKVADFGLSEKIYSQNYFRQLEVNNSSPVIKLPVKWMALESLHDGLFSEKSDVWSYGVLCWEVFSLGRVPYPGLDPVGVVELLNTGGRLYSPNNEACSKEIYSLMMSCWSESPNDRPVFSDLVSSINALIEPLAGYLDLDVHTSTV